VINTASTQNISVSINLLKIIDIDGMHVNQF